MKEATKRSISRWIHLILAIPIVGYIYSAFVELSNYAPVVRYIALPGMVITGLWMWKGHLLRRTFSKDRPQSTPA
jgi:thiosulfate reductase cytochrome b subunit